MLVRERQRCPSCGTRPEEWDPEQGGHRRAYLAQADICRGCEAIESRQSFITDEQRQNNRGLRVVLARNPKTIGR